MALNSYKYDVAFSFVEKDEPLALRLYKLLSDRIDCFIYSEAQKELAGRDGVNLFNSIFGKDSRIVVVLYRNNWGKTKWTRIEETAIKNRGYEEGYDFTILIPLDKPATPPDWFPKPRLWVGLERWGIESAAAAIESRVQEFGGVVKEKTIADLAEETERKIREAKEREQKINYDNFTHEFKRLKENFKEQIGDIIAKSGWQFQTIENSYEGLNIYSSGYTLFFHWYQQYRNSLIDASLLFSMIHGSIDKNGSRNDPFSDNSPIETISYYFHINELDEMGWKFSETKFFTTQKLVDYWLKKMVTLISKKRLGRNFD